MRPKPRVVDYENTPNDIVNAQLERAAKRYFETREWDASNRMSFIGEGQRLALKTQIISGDVILNAVKSKTGSIIPIAWQMVEVDRLDNSKDTFKKTFEVSQNMAQTVHGINIDEYGAPVSYWFKGIDTPVSANNIIHSYLQERPEQYIGEPLGTAILDAVYDKHDLDEDYVLKSRAIAKFLWWLSTLSDKWPYSGDQDSSGVIEMDSLTQFRSETNPDIFKMPDNVSQTIEPLLRMKKHDVCSGMGISYITVLLDMANVNFAAASMNNLKEELNFNVLRQMFIESFCQPMWNKFVSALAISGKLTGVSAERFILDPYHYTRCEWTHDPIGHADPSKVSSAKIADIQAKRETLTDDLAARGIDIRDHVKKLQTEMELFKAAGLEYPPKVDIPKQSEVTDDDDDSDDNDDVRNQINALTIGRGDYA